MSGVERADGSRGSGVFPVEWGFPPGSTYSEERAAWVRRNIRLTPFVAYRRLVAQDSRLLWKLRLAELQRRS